MVQILNLRLPLCGKDHSDALWAEFLFLELIGPMIWRTYSALLQYASVRSHV